MPILRLGKAAGRAAWAILVVFVFSVPLEKTVFVDGFGTISRILGLAAFCFWAAALLLSRQMPRNPTVGIVFAASFVAWAGLSVLWSLDPPESLVRARTLAQLFAMVILIWDLCRTERRQSRLMEAYVLGSAVGAVNAFVRYLQGQQTYYRRYAAEGFEPNDFGLVLALSLPMAFYLSMRPPAWKGWFYRACAALAIWGVYLTASRTALAATVVAFVFLAVTMPGAARQHKAGALLLAVFLVLGQFKLAPASSRERLATITHEATRGTFHGRTAIWKAGFRVWRSHVFAGVGVGAYPEAVKPWIGVPQVEGHRYVAHNTFLSILVEQGLAGSLLFACLLGTLILYVWAMAGPERALWGVLLAVWATGVSTLTWEHYKPTWLIFSLLMTAWSRSFHEKDAEP